MGYFLLASLIESPLLPLTSSLLCLLPSSSSLGVTYVVYLLFHKAWLAWLTLPPSTLRKQMPVSWTQLSSLSRWRLFAGDFELMIRSFLIYCYQVRSICLPSKLFSYVIFSPMNFCFSPLLVVIPCYIFLMVPNLFTTLGLVLVDFYYLSRFFPLCFHSLDSTLPILHPRQQLCIPHLFIFHIPQLCYLGVY